VFGSRNPLGRPGRTALSVVVVLYNMRRAGERTLRSLSRAYQEGIDDLDYEVIAVENGSAPEQKLGEQLVRGLGPEFRYVDLGADATQSPVGAVNRGIAIAGGEAVALMIDGAHLLTPGVLHFGMLGLETFEPAMVATQQWYLGPGQQPEAVRGGYDERYEDRLLEEIGWPADGYRLFEIGHFIGERDWFDGILESNCVFAPRRLVEQVGGMDERFSMPGGGYANLDFYERIGSIPEVTIVSILGEGSFHQLHDGVTTNLPDPEQRKASLLSYGQHYAGLRGRPLRSPLKPIHYIGAVNEAAKRTRARRMAAPALWKQAQDTEDGGAERPVPIPSDLKVDFIDAFWRSFAWRKTSWLGQPLPACPTDLFAYQELVARVKPDWIIDVGGGERAWFFASICELLGSGRVLSIRDGAAEEPSRHPRLTEVVGDAVAGATVARVREIVGEAPHALLVLGAAGAGELMRAFEAYAGLVPVGSYAVFEGTIMRGNPVRSEMPPGPKQAVRAILERREDFAPDPELEKFGLTFNPGGFLKRLK
jgi:cephalosporin hydroxylase